MSKLYSTGCLLEGLMLKLKLQYFGHLMWRADSLEKTLMLGGIGAGEEGDDRGWDGWMASLTRWTWLWVNSGSWWWTGRPGVLRFMGLQRVGHNWATELNWNSICPSTKQLLEKQNSKRLNVHWMHFFLLKMSLDLFNQNLSANKQQYGK